MRYLIVSFIAILILSQGDLFAQESSLSKEYAECMDSGGVRERSICIDTELERQDARLNNLYKQLIQLETEDRKQMLRSAQRNWIKFKEEWIKYINNIPDSDFLTQENNNLTTLMITVQQADRLKEVIDNLEYIKSNQ